MAFKKSNMEKNVYSDSKMHSIELQENMWNGVWNTWEKSSHGMM
jgi:hypothetical protein